ncbi:MAG: hypothetical protein ACOZIN_06375 [Myxococcota bacterium]
MRFLITVGIALVLLAVESVVVRYLGLSVSRIDVTVALVVFLSIRASVAEGAFSSFAIGYLLDVMSGRPTGLYPFLAVLTFVLARLPSALVEVRGPTLFVLFAAGADLFHGLLGAFFSWLTSPAGTVPTAALSGLPLQVLLTAVAARLMWPLLRRIDPGSERHDAGALR